MSRKGKFDIIFILKQTCLSIFWLFTDYFINHVVSHIPFWILRKYILKLFRATIGHHSQIDMNVTLLAPYKLNIGSHTHINRQCLIDSRGDLKIGNNVSISLRSSIVTGSHNIRSPYFEYFPTKIVIDDYVWIGYQATIVGNVHVGEGAVICAGSIVTKDVEPWSIVAGIPAKKIGERPSNVDYQILGNEYFFPKFS